MPRPDPSLSPTVKNLTHYSLDSRRFHFRREGVVAEVSGQIVITLSTTQHIVVGVAVKKAVAGTPFRLSRAVRNCMESEVLIQGRWGLER